jgi:BlaI family transcriptional regulator, penicillinase repressor
MLKPNELEILRVLWKNGSLKPAEIQDRLAAPVKNSALRAQLTSLVERGQLKRRRRGKAFYYSAAMPKESAFEALSRRIADVFFEGSSVALVGQLIESADDWSEEDLDVLRRIAERKTASNNSSGTEKKGGEAC